MFPTEIQIALEQYNHRKGFFRRLFGDHPAVRAIRKLPNIDKQDSFKLYRCFNKNNKPALSQASFQVYQAVLNYFLASSGLVCPQNLEYLDLASPLMTQETVSKNNLWVGLLHWDTVNKQTLMLEERHELIKTAVERLEKQANGQPCLLVAPEYFYSRPLADSFETHRTEVNHVRHSIAYLGEKTYSNFYKNNKEYPPGSIRQIEKNSYKKIMCFLKNLSSQHPNLILFPGTIAYREEIIKEKDNLALLKKRIEDNLKNICFHNRGASVFFYNLNFEHYFREDKKNKDKIQYLKKFKYVAKNTAPCFYQGKKLFAQNKVFNFSEMTEAYPKREKLDILTDYTPETFFLPGVYQGEVGKINDLSFAIDICADHPRSFLKQSLEKKEDRRPLALHICQSASVKGKLKSQSQSIGGYFIHVSSKLEYNTVIKREGEFFYKKESPYLEEK
ncbi:hypothetical protein [Rickettsiella massiliensis]|uniref:hypothetical protein n=1 Tax=Rickettsiella massiliensis TaxID=676517 RepID=UPI00029B165E|nr:hypothetical protein [Rickettsiella massiliensis]